jgi:hypothetical protein
MDNDDVGVQIAWYHVGLLRRSGYTGRVRVYRPPAGCKDVQLLLANGGAIADLVEVRRSYLARLSEALGPLARAFGGGDGGWDYEASTVALELGEKIAQSGWKVTVQGNGS